MRNRTREGMIENVEAGLHFIDGRNAIMDKELAEILNIPLSRIRTTLSRHLKFIPEEEVFHPKECCRSSWAFTEVGALFLVSEIRTPETDALSVAIVREVVRSRCIQVSLLP